MGACRGEKPNNLEDTLSCTSEDLYPNVATMLTILLTMPVSTAPPERSFRTMRRVKTYVRSTMLIERLSSLALMHAYREMPIDPERVIVYGFKSDIATETILENLRWPPLTKTMEKHCTLLVNKCLVGEIPLYFKDYFMLRSQSDSQHVYNRCTRSSITDIILPKIHLDVAKKSFYYHGASLFNRLPTIIKTLPPKERFQAISSFYS